MDPKTSIPENGAASTPEARKRKRLYFLLLAVQTAGAGLLLNNALPIYRQAVGDFSKHRPHPGILWWAVAAVGMIQGAYWAAVRLRVGPPKRGHVVIGHLAAFVARLSFIFASSSFTLVFIVRFEDLGLPFDRILMILAMLFSMFCYTVELERLAKALYGIERTQ